VGNTCRRQRHALEQIKAELLDGRDLARSATIGARSKYTERTAEKALRSV
jgi:hypothetical protein